MPFVARYPAEIAPGSRTDALVLNVDFAPAFLDYAGAPIPDDMQGRSCRAVLRGETLGDWRTSMYYRYFMHDDPDHGVYAHYGLRTDRYKLIYYCEDEPGPQEWELFDLLEDPQEMRSVYDDPAYAHVVEELTAELKRLREDLGDTTNPWGE
jgi:arylsulfatase A-like enzyme